MLSSFPSNPFYYLASHQHMTGIFKAFCPYALILNIKNA
jgi:hypothetical protein